MAETHDQQHDARGPQEGQEGPQTARSGQVLERQLNAATSKPEPEPHVHLEHDEMVLILEEIAREGSDTARIQAIKLLRQMASGDDDVEDDLERLIQTK